MKSRFPSLPLFIVGVVLAAGPASSSGQPAPDAYLAFLGDAGTGGTSQKRVRDQLMGAYTKDQLDWIFLLGDNIYGRGQREYFGSRFLNIYQQLLDGSPRLHAALGNHDVKECNRRAFEPRWRDSRAYPDCADVESQLDPVNRFGYPAGARYYSVAPPGEPPLFEVFVLDTNTLPIRANGGRLEDPVQVAWLDEALGDSRAHWKIVAFHNPVHSPRKSVWYSSRGREEDLRDVLEPVFQRHRVDAVFQGHQHFYARILPQQGVRYFVTGGGGKGVYRYKPDPDYVIDPDGSRGKFHHFVHIRLTGEAFRYCAVDEFGRVRDSGRFAKGDGVDRPAENGECSF